MVIAKSKTKKKSNSHIKKTTTKKKVVKKVAKKKHIKRAIKKITKKTTKRKIAKKTTTKKKQTKKKVVKKRALKKKPTKKAAKKPTKKKQIKKVSSPKPKFKVSEGDILQLEIKETAIDEGICKYKGFLFFVKGATKGDIVTARVIKVIENVCLAETTTQTIDSEVSDIPEISVNKEIPKPPKLDDLGLEIPDLPDF
ncbi:MAG: hypothetical protein KAQ83_04180 [Nanoarchaeota archaeon]|nr:hypothetical protein [Nanoarchaeota archaeon]